MTPYLYLDCVQALKMHLGHEAQNAHRARDCILARKRLQNSPKDIWMYGHFLNSVPDKNCTKYGNLDVRSFSKILGITFYKCYHIAILHQKQHA